MTTPAERKRRILEAARREPSPTRRHASRRIAWIVATALVADVGLFFLFGGVHAGGRSLPLILATQGGCGLFAVLAVWGAFGRGRSMLGRPKSWLVVIAAATPILLLSWTLVWSALYPETAMSGPNRIGLRCLGFTLALAVLPLAFILGARREKDPTAPALLGAARGAAIGSLAWVLVALWCPFENVAHLALGHFLPVLCLSAFGSWLGSRVLGVGKLAT